MPDSFNNTQFPPLSLFGTGIALRRGLSTNYFALKPGKNQHWVVCCCWLAGAAVSGWGQTIDSPKSRLSDLADMSLEDLTKIEVTSVSKHKEKLSEAPAAIFVITQEDIRRSGATTIADALRLAPGLEVARVDGHDWAITSRGFNELYANKLLVVIDGRSVYTPLFSGVQWDAQDTMLEDIDQIEVIRGPGATLWGANAVNGVINVTTKSARETQGGLISGGAGTQEQGFGSARYGGKLGENGYYRVYGKYFNREASPLPSGARANDAWDMYRGGFRTDWEPSAQNLLTFQGDVYTGTENQTAILFMPSAPYTNALADKSRLSGANAIARWTHNFSAESDLRFQMYYDWAERETGFFKENRSTLDSELQYRHALGRRQDVTWGIGYRYTDSQNSKSNFTLAFIPLQRVTRIFNAFVQDEITLVKERLRLTLGSKFENNDYTGLEIQPSGRLLWTPHERHSLWASVSRAVRTPSRAEVDSRIVTTNVPAGPAPVTAFGVVDGNPAFQSEILLAYELGYRVQPHERLSLDLAAFYNDYDRLRSVEPQALDFSHVPAYLVAPNLFDNKLEGQTYGAELTGNFQAADWWLWRGSYSYLQIHLRRKAGSLDTLSQAAEGDTHHQVSLRSLMDLPYHLQLDCTGRYVDRLANQHIPSYVSLDVRLGWRPLPNWELALVGQNLVDNRHPEFNPSVIQFQKTEVERAVYGKVTFRF